MKYSQCLFSGHYQDRPRNSTAPGERENTALRFWHEFTEQDLLDAPCPSSSESDHLASVLDTLQTVNSKSMPFSPHLKAVRYQQPLEIWLRSNCSIHFPLEWTQMGTWLPATPCLQVNPKDVARTLPYVPSAYLTNSSKKTQRKM